MTVADMLMRLCLMCNGGEGGCNQDVVEGILRYTALNDFFEDFSSVYLLFFSNIIDFLYTVMLIIHRPPCVLQ